jgi:hypothetical protein
MKMKNTLGMFIAILLVLFSIGYSGSLMAQDEDRVDNAWRGSGNQRTWVVFDAEPNFHIKIGDAFRIERSGGIFQLVGINGSPRNWHSGSNNNIELIKKGSGIKRFCGQFEISNHPSKNHSIHYIVIHPPGHGGKKENELEIWIPHPYPEQNCDTLEFGIHGGIAHARN